MNIKLEIPPRWLGGGEEEGVFLIVSATARCFSLLPLPDLRSSL